MENIFRFSPRFANLTNQMKVYEPFNVTFHKFSVDFGSFLAFCSILPYEMDLIFFVTEKLYKIVI